VAAVLAAADIGVSPIQHNAFGEISMPTKALEYAVMGKPVVAADLPAAREHFDPDMLAWYRSGDPRSLAEAVLTLVDDPEARERAVARAAIRARQLSWDAEAPAYAQLVDEVAGVGSAAGGPAGATDPPPAGATDPPPGGTSDRPPAGGEGPVG
jgi:glycosyltransferase involved in cell wall biosynthesis